MTREDPLDEELYIPMGCLHQSSFQISEHFPIERKTLSKIMPLKQNLAAPSDSMYSMSSHLAPKLHIFG